LQRLEALEARNRELADRVQALEAAEAEARSRAQAAAAEAQASAAKAASDAWPQTIVSAYVQSQYESSQDSEDQVQQGGALLNRDRFSVRRGRLRLDLTWQYAGLSLELDANTTRGFSVGARRAYGTLFWPGPSDDAPPYAALAVGLQDIPFGYELPYGSRKRVFMERSAVSRALFPGEPDVGAGVSGGVGAFRYALAVLNGQPLDDRSVGPTINDPNAAKDVVGRVGVDVSPKPWLALTGGVSFLSGTGFHPGSDASKNGVRWADRNEDSLVGSAEITAAPGSAATPSKNFDRWAFGADLELGLRTGIGWSRLYGEVTLASNLDRALFVADPVATHSDVRELGYYLAFVQEVTPFGLVGFRTDFYDGNSDFTDSRRGLLLPAQQSVRTYSPLVGVVLPQRARLVFQYDFVRDHFARDTRGEPADLRNDQWTLRLQVGI
jgi:hypothetical protein